MVTFAAYGGGESGPVTDTEFCLKIKDNEFAPVGTDQPYDLNDYTEKVTAIVFQDNKFKEYNFPWHDTRAYKLVKDLVLKGNEGNKITFYDPPYKIMRLENLILEDNKLMYLYFNHNSTGHFEDNQSLKTIKFKGNNIFYVDGLKRFCWNCHNLEEVDMSGIGAVACVGDNIMVSADCEGMFFGCEKLRRADLSGLCYPGFDSLASYTKTAAMFCGCSSLEYVDISDFNIQYLGESMFEGVPAGCTVIVKNETVKNSIQRAYPQLNVVIKGEI